jgi:hypothetical protein
MRMLLSCCVVDRFVFFVSSFFLSKIGAPFPALSKNEFTTWSRSDADTDAKKDFRAE